MRLGSNLYGFFLFTNIFTINIKTKIVCFKILYTLAVYLYLSIFVLRLFLTAKVTRNNIIIILTTLHKKLKKHRNQIEAYGIKIHKYLCDKL